MSPVFATAIAGNAGAAASVAQTMAIAGNWQRAAAGVVREAVEAVGRERLRTLSRKVPAYHLAMATAWLATGTLGVALAAQDHWPWLWPVGIALTGLFAFNGTVLLHEVLHGLVFASRRPGAERALALLYALPCAIAPSQFTRWHLDHHAELGDPERDPKRRHLSPKRVSRLIKLAYWTPALFAIYFRAAARESERYDGALRRRITFERWTGIAVHAAVAAVLVAAAGWPLWLRAHALPLLAAFPPWFALNRLGQHYDIDPDDPARWGTLMRCSPFLWDPLFLWSGYHLEHHLFPGVPAYRLPALRRALAPFLARHRVPATGCPSAATANSSGGGSCGTGRHTPTGRTRLSLAERDTELPAAVPSRQAWKRPPALEAIRPLIDHLTWADRGIWAAIEGCEAARTSPEIAGRLYHLHVVRRAFWMVWQGRWITEFAWGVTPERLAAPARVPWFNDAPRIAAVGDSVLQVASHSTHHRGQIATRLREFGDTPPTLHYVAWVWKGRPPATWE